MFHFASFCRVITLTVVINCCIISRRVDGTKNRRLCQ